MNKKKKYKFTLAILSIFNNLWTRLSLEALHNRIIDSTITTYHHHRLVPSRTSGQRSREPVVVVAIHAPIIRLLFIHTKSAPLSLSFIYLSYAYARKLWNHARVSFKQINKRRSKRSGTSRFPFAIPHFFSNVRLSSGLFSHDITRTVYNRDWNRRVFISVQRSSSSSFFLSFRLLLFALVYLTQVFFFFFFRKEKSLETVAP